MFRSKKQKINQQTLLIALDSAMDNFMAADNVDELLSETGKTRQELLNAVLSDDEVESCREDLRTAMLAEPWRIWGEDVSEEAINRLYRIIIRLVDDFAELAILARFGGFAVAEYVYKREPDGFLTLDKVLSKDGELDLYTPRRDGSVTLNTEGEEIEINQDVKYLVLKSKAVPARPSGELMIIRAYPAVMLRRKGLAYANQFIARYSQPYVVGKKGSTTQQGALSDFTDALFGLLSGGAAGIGAEDDIALHQLRGDGVAFEKFEQLANKRIQKLLLGRVKTSELSSGSRAAQETDDQTRQDRVSAYLSLMSNAIQHALDAIIAVNNAYGRPIHAPQGLWFEYQQQFSVDTQRAERDKLYCDTGQVRLTKDYFLNIVGYEEEHIEIVEPAAVQAQPPRLPLGAPYSLKLSAPPAEGFSDEQLKDLDHLQPKIDAIFEALDESDSYAEFEQKLTALDLPDQQLINDLVSQCARSYGDGASGDKPVWSQ